MAKSPGVRVCIVVDVDDDVDGGRIRVRMHPDDAEKLDSELPWAFPLMPKIFYNLPKVGEAVLVFLSDWNNGNSQRYFVGPITSQLTKLFGQRFNIGSDAIFHNTPLAFDVAPSMQPELNGVFPKQTDVAILGRKNCDIIITDDDVRIRSGVKKVDEGNKFKMAFNEIDPGYFKLKYHTTPINGNHSTAVVTADKILLLSNQSTDPSLPTTDPDDLICDETIKNVLQEGYKLPYGEKLVEFLLKFVDVFSKHTHDFSGKVPNQKFINDINNAALEPLQNKKMLSDTVRIN